MTHIDAMKQGLEALEVEDMACRYEKEATPEYIAKAITALRTAIEQAEQAQPVEWMTFIPLYTAPPVASSDTSKNRVDETAKQRHEPVAWRTFDGEGGYDYRDYDMNENYDKEWAKRNPNHADWVEPLFVKEKK